MTLTSETKFFMGVIGATVVLVGLAAVFLTKPATVVTLPKETLIAADSHTKGSATASAYLVEFSDFQCPACRSMAPVVAQVTEKYKDNLLFAYRHLPLSQHQFAKPAAYAAEAAGKQGKFWEAEKILFENQEKFSDNFFATEFVQLVQLDQTKFDADYKSKDVRDIVDRDANVAAQLNLPGTPSFFLNGVRIEISGPSDLENAVIEAIVKNP